MRHEHPFAAEIPYWNAVAIGPVRGELRTMGLQLAYDGDSPFVGCFLDQNDQPGWARKIARYDRDEFHRDTPQRQKLFSGVESSLSSGEGEFHINTSDAFALWDKIPADKRGQDVPFGRAQDYGSCVDASLSEGITGLLGWRAARPENKEKFIAPAGWYEGANRGYRGDGQSLPQAATISSQIGYCLMRPYKSGGNSTDLSGDDSNEYLVWRRWSPQGVPDWLEAITSEKHAFLDGAITEFDGGIDELRKLLSVGGFLHTGGTYTSGAAGDPISPVGRVGAHAQTCFGYDDSEQFRKWYKDKGGRLRSGDFPIVMHQTWGDKWSGWCPPEAWPDWWGGRPAGAWCWWASDLLRYLGSGSYAYLPRLVGVPDDTPAPPPPPAPPAPPAPPETILSGDIHLTIGGVTYDYEIVPTKKRVVPQPFPKTIVK